MKERFLVLQELLNKGNFFKLVCGAGNEDKEEVRKLAFIYTLAGANGMDVSASPEVVQSCKEGIEKAFDKNKKLKTIPFITVSIGMSGDHHVRKALINNNNCISCDLCIPVCPTDAIPEELIIKEEKCIGCGNCSAICPVNVISYYHKDKTLEDVLPACMEKGAENIELHAGVPEDDTIMKEWELVNKINPDNHVSMCLDRQHLSDFQLEERIKKAKQISGNRLIIQADGIPMSGGEDDFNTTLQAIAITDIINKRFNKKINPKTKKSIYKKVPEINILISGGTNSLTAKFAKQNDVRFQGVSIGTFARNIIKPYLKESDFWKNPELIEKSVKIAKELVKANISHIEVEDN